MKAARSEQVSNETRIGLRATDHPKLGGPG